MHCQMNLWNQMLVPLKHAPWTEKLVLAMNKNEFFWKILLIKLKMLRHVFWALQILEAPSLLLTRRSRTPLPEFNVTCYFACGSFSLEHLIIWFLDGNKSVSQSSYSLFPFILLVLRCFNWSHHKGFRNIHLIM